MKYIKWLTTITVAFSFLIGAFVTPNSASAASTNYQVEINKKTNKLYLYQGGKVIKTYPVATGRTKDLTPEGTFTTVVKIVQPGWKGIPGGAKENPLGPRWIGFSVRGDNGRTYGIHGTNNPASIGTYASNGCVRMKEAHILELYKIVPEGTPIWIHGGKSTSKWGGSSTAAVQSSKGTVKVKGNKVNIRTGPSTGSFIVTQVNNGTTLEVVGKSGDWYQVKVSGKTGFIRKDFVTSVSTTTPTSQSQSSGFSKASGTIVPTENLVNVRTSPSMTAQVHQKVSKGTKMTLIGESKEWFQIKTKSGYTAYVHKSVAKKS